jgi:hypothetical protein
VTLFDNAERYTHFTGWMLQEDIGSLWHVICTFVPPIVCSTANTKHFQLFVHLLVCHYIVLLTQRRIRDF